MNTGSRSVSVNVSLANVLSGVQMGGEAREFITRRSGTPVQTSFACYDLLFSFATRRTLVACGIFHYLDGYGICLLLIFMGLSLAFDGSRNLPLFHFGAILNGLRFMGI